VPAPTSLTPKQIVAELDRYIVGQKAAKRAVAIALRNRWRRFHVAADLRDEVMPKNIILVGPTGVGKTEIARRLAKLAEAPFVKVEASKFTEVGYVGRDVDSMIRDLMEAGIQLVREEQQKRVQPRAEELAEDRVLELLLPNSGSASAAASTPGNVGFIAGATGPATPAADAPQPIRESTRDKLGALDEKLVEVELSESASRPTMQIFGSQGVEEMGVNLQEMLSGLPFGGGKKKSKRKIKVAEARRLLVQEEADKLIDRDGLVREALERVQSSGIVFIDEIDKVASPGGGGQGGGGGHGPDVSRGGVQRDLLPLVEGSTVTTKYGAVKTDHVLFIAAGAFHVSKVSDLIPELQGRFPIRVELEPLTQHDLVRVLTEPKNSLLKQVVALLATEGVELVFETSGAQEIARIAAQLNERAQNIGARRLHAVVEKVLDEVSFSASEPNESKRVVVNAEYVRSKLESVLQDEDLSRYIL